MTARKLILFAGLFFVLTGARNLSAQSTCIGITLNEYCVTGVPGGGSFTDAFGELSDWVEIKNTFQNPVSLAGYYLSNDKNNLFKWPCPNIMMPVNSLQMFYLSGRNTTKVNSLGETEYHTNFTLDQCKGQYLMLVAGNGTIRDSVYVQQTAAGHTRGRVDCNILGIEGWKLYKNHSRMQDNPTTNNYDGYSPTPRLYTSDITDPSVFNLRVNTGRFINDPSQLAYFKLGGYTYDTTYSCYDIFYTLNGDYPVPGYPPVEPTQRYIDSASSSIPLTKTTIIRFISVPKQSPNCPQRYLPSFCETNTYFIDPEHNLFDPNFGVVSIALESKSNPDTAWFNSNGAFEPTVHVEYYDKNQQMSEGYGILSRPFQEEWKTAQKGYYISIDDRHGVGCGFEGQVFNVEGLGASTRTMFPTLHLKSGDIESNSGRVGITPVEAMGTAIRDVFYQSLAAKHKLNVSPLHVKPVIAFLNGKYQGVYDLREVYDKYYENYYNGQPLDKQDLNFVHKGVEGSVTYWDDAVSTHTAHFYNEVYGTVMTKSMRSAQFYNDVMNNLDKSSLIDYMILNSYAMNSDLWMNNIALARGGDRTKPGGKWHYYLWNMPTIFNFTAVPTNAVMYNNPNYSPCLIHTAPDYTPTTRYWNGHGNIIKRLMNPISGNPSFQLEYKNRYQDLLNGPLKCENILKHYDFVVDLYAKEMRYHEDPASVPEKSPFALEKDKWDTLVSDLRKIVAARCYIVENYFKIPGCYGLGSQKEITVDVRPEGAGKVRLNSIILDEYTWTGSYYPTEMSLKAIPVNDEYAFHHWELKHVPKKNALSMDSIVIDFNQPDNVVAVFTDKKNPIAFDGDFPNIPTGFTPNGDGYNDYFGPLGSGEYAQEYQMTIWNRWGQEVFRSVDPNLHWDGNYKGQQAITGVYAYVITYKNIYNESKVLKGNVTLTR